MTLEDKILGRKRENMPSVKEKEDLFGSARIWEVDKEGCGKSVVNGRMAYEMMDRYAKNEVMGGKREIYFNGFKFKLVK